jgi:hypothetical protein
MQRALLFGLCFIGIMLLTEMPVRDYKTNEAIPHFMLHSDGTITPLNNGGNGYFGRLFGTSKRYTPQEWEALEAEKRKLATNP